MLNDKFEELIKQINEGASRVHSSVTEMPKIQQNIGEKQKFIYRSRFFIIGDNVSAAEYADFINIVISNPSKFKILREKESWTQHGELMKFVEYMQHESVEDEEPTS